MKIFSNYQYLIRNKFNQLFKKFDILIKLIILN